MKTWFIADTRFGDSAILERQERGFKDVETMDRRLVTNWNWKVEPEDLVYHLGGVTCHEPKRSKEIISSLNGTKICIRGIRDPSPKDLMKMGFSAVLEAAFMRIGDTDFYLNHEPFPRSIKHTWCLHGSVHREWKFKAVERKICLSVENWAYSPVSEKILTTYIDMCNDPWGMDESQIEDEEEKAAEKASEDKAKTKSKSKKRVKITE